MSKTSIPSLVLLLLACGARCFSQESDQPFKFDCGTITPTGSGVSVYQDFEHGFRFELPTGWVGYYGGYGGLAQHGKPETIFVEALFDTKDARRQLAQGTTVTGNEQANGLTWATLTFTDVRRGNYGYSLEHDGILVQVVASPLSTKEKTSPPSLAAAVKQIVSTFRFTDDPYRLDRQLAALKPGDKLGELTVRRVIHGSGGFDHPVATIEFSGQLTLSGEVILPSPTMLGGWAPYTMYPDDASGPMLPRLKCPVEVPEKEGVSKYAVQLSNQRFVNQQFAQVPSISGPHSFYESLTTVVVDDISESFYNAAMAPQVSARLVRVLSKKEP